MNLLTLQNVSKSFGGLKALNGINLTVRDYGITSLIGPNGSGKTTLFNLVTGLYRPDKGNISFKDKDLTRIPAHRICALGIARTFQIQQLFGELTVLENVMLGGHTHSKSGFWAVGLRLPGARQEEKLLQEQAQEILEFLGIKAQAYEKASHLSYGEQRLVEIGKALAAHPRLLLLDEPAAGFNAGETMNLGNILHKITQRGIAVFLVEHDMSLVMRVSDWMIVLHEGEKICEGPPAEVRDDPRVISAYLGGDSLVPA